MLVPLILIVSLTQIHTVGTNTSKPTESSTATTTTSTTTTATPAPTSPPEIGGSCSEKADSWCNDGISGDAECHTDVCKCVDGYFTTSATRCIQSSSLNPTSLTINEASITSTSLTALWTLTDEVTSLDLSIVVEATNLETGTVVNCTVTRDNLTVEGSSDCAGMEPGYEFTLTISVSFVDSNDVMTTSPENTNVTQAINPAQPGSFDLAASILFAPNFTVAWGAPRGRVEYYSVIMASSGVSEMNTTGNVTQFVFYGLDAGTLYTNMEVTAHSHGRRSVPKRLRFTTETVEPGPPTEVTVSNIRTTEVTLSWVAPEEANGNIEKYQICGDFKTYNNKEYTNFPCENATDSSVTFTLQNLSEGVFYVFNVATINDKYMSESSADVSVRTKESTPDTVSNLKVTPNNTSFIVTWQRPSKPNGDIITYRVDVNSTALNSSCVVFLKSELSSVNETDVCNTTAETDAINVNKESMNFTIFDLKPVSSYYVTVTAYTSVGPGVSVTETQNSSIVRPEPVTNVTATVLGPTEVNISWIIPRVNPGPANYTVKVYDLVSKDDGWVNCTKEGFNSSSCLVDSLEEYWEYMFSVTACSGAGCSAAVNVTAGITTTEEGTPGQPYITSVTTYTDEHNCDASKVKLKWTEPELRSRNAYIDKYIIFDDSNTTIQSYSVDEVKPYNPDARNFASDVQVHPAEIPFKWRIRAVSRHNVNGFNSEEYSFKTGVCKPPDWVEERNGQITSTGVTESTILLTLYTSFFQDTTQGRIMDKGLLIATKKNDFQNHPDIANVSNWQNAKKNQFATTYKIKLEEISSGQNIVTIVLGEDRTCSANTDVPIYCNGQLPENTDFYLAGYACTHASKCTSGIVFGPFSTSKTPPPEEDSTAVIVLSIVLVIAIVTSIAIFGFLWYRGVINPPGWIKKSGGDAPDGVPVSPVYDIKRKRPILLSDYDKVLEELHRDTNLVMSDQYDDIGKLSQQIMEQSTTDMSILEPNKAKNRWVNILPFDHSRVKLQQLDDDEPTTDYINANYMPGFNNKREYIATQGPLPGTTDDFWRMVWEHNVMVIVMLTQCKEGNRVKCEKYWPDEVREPKQYGEVVVNPISISQMDKYNITIFNVSQNNQSREVKHFHYLDFPDFSANVEFDHFVNFVKTVRTHMPHDMVGPIVCHCSAGVGRTGTFIAVDRLQLFLDSPKFSLDESVDIFDIVMSMRENRVLMVQTESQFVMIHDCFQQMLDAKKASLLEKKPETKSEENLYANEGFDPYPEVLYENINSDEMKTEL